MRLANSALPDDLDLNYAAMERELDAVVDAFVERWFGKYFPRARPDDRGATPHIPRRKSRQARIA